MYPELFTIPILNMPVESYPFFIFVGLIAALITAQRRAKKVDAKHDLIPTAILLTAFFGLAGCRLFHVIHYWEEEFAHQPSPLKAALKISAGGAELYGGVILSILVLIIYFKLHRVSVSLFFDILTPSMVLAQGFGRFACFMNGCCWGAPCMTVDYQPNLPWAVRFPYGSLPFNRQWGEEKVHVPEELLYTYKGKKEPVPAKFLKLTEEQYRRLTGRAGDLADSSETSEPDESDKKLWASRMRAINQAVVGSSEVGSTDYGKLVNLREQAKTLKTLPVHPVQLYFSVNAFLLSFLLAEIFKRRSRDGMVMAGFLVLYPVTRVVQEIMRGDNPRDVLGLMTASTAVSIGVMVVGILYLIWLTRQPRQFHPDSFNPGHSQP